MTHLDRLRSDHPRKPVKLTPDRLEEYAAFSGGRIELDPDTGTAHLYVKGTERAWASLEESA